MGNAKAILLVEDNQDDIDLAKRALQRDIHEINLFVVTNGQDAIDILYKKGKFTEQSIPPFDLILLDINLPKVNGLEVLRRIRNDGFSHNIPIVMLTSSKDPQDMKRANTYGANSYVQKPIRYKEFETLMHKLTKYWFDVNKDPPKNSWSV